MFFFHLLFSDALHDCRSVATAGLAYGKEERHLLRQARQDKLILLKVTITATVSLCTLCGWKERERIDIQKGSCLLLVLLSVLHYFECKSFLYLPTCLQVTKASSSSSSFSSQDLTWRRNTRQIPTEITDRITHVNAFTWKRTAQWKPLTHSCTSSSYLSHSRLPVLTCLSCLGHRIHIEHIWTSSKIGLNLNIFPSPFVFDHFLTHSSFASFKWTPLSFSLHHQPSSLQ